MIVARDAKEIPGGGAFVLTIGVFDGVHRGHRAVLDALRQEAMQERAKTLVVTLDPHPREVLTPDSAPLLLTTPDERCDLFEEFAGPLDAALVQRFDREIASLTPDAFLQCIVPPASRLAGLVLGHDFRMGKGRSGGYEELVELSERDGFRVMRVPPLASEGEAVSSSAIRERVQAGQLKEARRLLGHPYRVHGIVVPGRGMGRGLGFPTANVAVDHPRKLLPAFGVYAVRVRLPEETAFRDGVMNWGTRPTFGPGAPTLEVHLPGFSGDLRGLALVVDLIDRIRAEQRFPGPEALVAAIARDVDEARKILAVGE